MFQPHLPFSNFLDHADELERTHASEAMLKSQMADAIAIAQAQATRQVGI